MLDQGGDAGGAAGHGPLLPPLQNLAPPRIPFELNDLKTILEFYCYLQILVFFVVYFSAGS